MGTILVYRLQVHGGSKTEATSVWCSHVGLGVRRGGPAGCDKCPCRVTEPVLV